MTIDYKDICFCYDFDRLTSDGRLFDYGSHEIHASFGAAAAAPTRQLDGSYLFDGLDYFVLGANYTTRNSSTDKFYRFAPTREHTWLVKYTSTTDTLEQMIFSSLAFSAPNYYGLIVDVFGMTNTQKITSFQGQGGAALPGVYTFGGAVKKQETTVFSVVVSAAPTQTLMINGKSSTATWSGALGTAAFITTVIPCIGVHPAAFGSGGVYGRIYYLALINKALSNSDLAFYNQMILDGQKPWCNR
jgi:hypothetical protein